MSTALVLGIGNILLSDEGIGIHVLNYLTSIHSDLSAVEYLDGGTLSFILADHIQKTENLVVIDAMRCGKPAGTVSCLKGTQFDEFIGKAKLSAHEVGLADLLDIARLTETLPSKRALVGIEPMELGWGDAPTAAVRDAIPFAAEQVMSLLTDWGVISSASAAPKSGSSSA